MRRSALADLPGCADVVVIGGGITGAATARDAALRGLSVVLLEREDWAAGTSSRSTKLLHGGLRYLQTYQFRMVRESVRERELMLELASHLAHRRPFIYLLYEGDQEGRLMLNAGLTLYDAFSGSPLRRRHRMLDRAALLEREPGLDPRGLEGGGWYSDVLTDDARVTLDTVQGAVAAGASAINHCTVTGLARTGTRVTGVRAQDELSGEEREVRARVVLNAAGPWSDAVRRLEAEEAPRLLGPTKGAHLVLRASDFPLRHAVFLRSPRDGRVVWPIPALEPGLVYVGTTDTQFAGDPDEVVADEDDVRYLLEVANRTLPDADLDESHVVGTWAGLRPLVAPPESTAASKASREHEIVQGPGGMISILGGKLTTARVMAEQLVNVAVKALGEHHRVRGVPAGRSREVPLHGGDPAGIYRARRAIGAAGVEDPVAARWERYGAAGTALASRAAADPAAGQPIGGDGVTPAEVAHAIEQEGACTVADVLVRRTASFFWEADGGLAVAEAVADALGARLGWSAAQRSAELSGYRRWVSLNRPRR